MDKDNNDKVLWSLFSGSGLDVKPFADLGWKCYCINYDEADHGSYTSIRVLHPNIEYVNHWIDMEWAENVGSFGIPKPDLLLSFPPCTDMAVSGAAWFESKRLKNPLFQVEAVRTAKIAAYLGEYVFECPYLIENPVSVLSTMWRKPDFMFHPYEYGGYLPMNDIHPLFPEYIKARDAYPKKTCLWTGNNLVLPPKKPVIVSSGYSKQHKKLGGKGARTKMIRSLSPRGFFEALAQYN